MGQTFRAICPAASVLHVFELVSENGRTVGWCTKCRRTWPLSVLSDQAGEDGPAPKPGAPRSAPRGKSRKR
ncbi:hypothetical protein [Telmatospirillum siberiense]|uniref:Uncharacterized protein n=1 Tax=Telmatospirillum siberiense TaxID=382514 RepID=A0A2N3PPL5_9PROT|nr:hypothetical protein [Telmatospirillum siberiense]PKU22353.1 hypothetical protein CWS72_22000 [Telmatospirillum siberiense]